jgi:hypothetical protein
VPAARASTKSAVLIAHCPLTFEEGTCRWCGERLNGRRKTWCSEVCSDGFWQNHWWTMARRAAKKRDKHRCVRCGVRAVPRSAGRAARRAGRLEVNHKVQCLGRHGSLSCSHHLDNLETLCPPCHRVHTNALLAAAAAK